MNKVILMGRIVNDPDICEGTEDKKSFVRFTLAVDRRYVSGKDGTASDFIPCVQFGERALDFAEDFLAKGMQIIVIGRISTGSYIDKAGDRKFVTDVVIDEIEFTESKPVNDAYREKAALNVTNDSTLPAPDTQDITDDYKLPF